MRVAARVLVCCATLTAAALAAAPEPQPALTSALGLLRDGHPQEAVAPLQAVIHQDPRSAQAWRALGSAYRQLKKPRDAMAAYRHSLDIEPDAPQALYAMGVLYASMGDKEAAFEWLGRARASGKIDMTQLTQDPAAGKLRLDSRYQALMPRPGDFEHSFVEPVTVLREWRGEAANDQFGWIARNIGDVDGDGVDDMVTSAPTHAGGRIYVYSVGKNRLLWTADGKQGDELGTGLEAAGDTNRDGIPDVIAGGPSARGMVRVYSGRDGRVLHTFRSPNANELFGTHCSGAGDVDGDGYADVIVGSPGKPGEEKTPGHAYVYSGKDGSLLRTFQGERPGDQFGSTVSGFSKGTEKVLLVGAALAGPAKHGRMYVYDGSTGPAKFVIDADETGAALGAMFVSVLGDVDGDGRHDLFVSDWQNNARGFSSGRVYVYSGATGQRLLTLTGETLQDGFGTSASKAGDVDGDDRADLIVGAWQYSGAAIGGGRAYLYSGRDGKLLRTFTDRVPGDTFGFDAVGLGDIDGDGSVDLLITAAWSAVRGYHSGRVFVLSSGERRLRSQ